MTKELLYKVNNTNTPCKIFIREPFHGFLKDIYEL